MPPTDLRRPRGASRRRPTTTLTTSGQSAPISSRARSSPPTHSACSPCRCARRSAGSRRVRGIVPLETSTLALPPSRHETLELRVDTSFDAVVAAAHAPASRRAGSTTVSPPRTAACTSSAGPLGRGVGRRRARRRPLRRRDGRAVHGRVDVPRPRRRVEGGVRRPRASDSGKRVTPTGGLDVQWLTPYLATLGAVEVTAREVQTTARDSLRLAPPGA